MIRKRKALDQATLLHCSVVQVGSLCSHCWYSASNVYSLSEPALLSLEKEELQYLVCWIRWSGQPALPTYISAPWLAMTLSVVHLCLPWTTSGRRWTLQTWEHPSGAAVCEVLQLSNPVVADWLLSNSIKSSRLPLFPVSSINFDVSNLLRNTSDVPWWKDNPCSLHLSAVIILFQISVERQMAASNSSLLCSSDRSCFKRNREHFVGKKMIGPLKVDFVVNKRGKNILR